MLARAGVALATVIATVGGLLTWEVVALVVSTIGLVVAVAALLVAREAFRRTESVQEAQADRIEALEQPMGD